MIAVLIDSRKVGASSLITVREARKLRISGLDGDSVRILFFNGDEMPLAVDVTENCDLVLPPCHAVRAEHVTIGKGRVFVDLMR